MEIVNDIEQVKESLLERKDNQEENYVVTEKTVLLNKKAVKITQIDPILEYLDNFRSEFINTLYQDTVLKILSYGEWWYSIKKKVYDEERFRRKFRLQDIQSPVISRELLSSTVQILELVTVNPTVNVNFTDIQCAVCILCALKQALSPNSVIKTFEEELLNVPMLLQLLLTEIYTYNKSENVYGNYMFNDNPNIKLYTPERNKKYTNGTFDTNTLIKILYRAEALRRLPGDLISLEAEASLPITLQPDFLFRVTAQLLGPFPHRVPIFVQEQYYLRAGLLAIASLLYMSQILDSETVFAADQKKFDISIFLHTESKASEPAFEARNIKNFKFLWENYVVPTYKENSAVTTSSLFPGLVLLGIHAGILNNWVEPGHVASRNKKGAVSLHFSRKQPVLTYLLVHNTAPRRPVDTLIAHDEALFCFEYGINTLLNQNLLKINTMKICKRWFNVENIYELCYFFVLGFLPVEVII